MHPQHARHRQLPSVSPSFAAASVRDTLTSKQPEAVLRQRVRCVWHLAQQAGHGPSSTQRGCRQARQLLQGNQHGQALEAGLHRAEVPAAQAPHQQRQQRVQEHKRVGIAARQQAALERAAQHAEAKVGKQAEVRCTLLIHASNSRTTAILRQPSKTSCIAVSSIIISSWRWLEA